ncbi:LuxR C-terminal-related transcriptional regulator [Algibacter sp. 2305UL17-15]|uniref:helix-turn-helix and ligand-binding sensor domain-containing protein n=1 Tax=Algibacter sp. 2305UL17-15 TaxID=3231268 RepID=UPI00345A66E4
MKSTNYISLLLLFSFSFILKAQERPPINIFYSNDYGGESQNWSVSQSEKRNIYVANNKGLLEYNGAKWNLYESPNQTIIRSVKVKDSLIYTGSYRDFGYWKRNNYGVLNYTSLSKELGIEFLEDEEFWNIMFLDKSILFQSLDRILIYNTSTKGYSTIGSETKISRLFKISSNFYFQSLNKGLYKIENGKALLVSDHDILKSNVIVNIFNHNNATLILTQDKGFYNLKDNTIIPWNIPANKTLADVSVFSCIQLKDKSYMLGTISNGIIHLETTGKINYQIAQANGLSNNTVLAIHEDLDNNIWLGLDNGINCINMNSPCTIYFDSTGRIGSVYTSKVYNDMLYLGTNQGLFCKPLKNNGDFQFVEGTQGQVWFLDVIDKVLFCGHNSGTFTIKDKKANKIANVQGTWQIKPIKEHDNLLIQGNYDGLNILHKNNGQWQLRNKIKGFDISSRYFEFLNTEEIYVNHEYKGVFKLKLNTNFTEVLTFSRDTLVVKGLNSSLIKYDGNLLYTIRKGVFNYDTLDNKFKKDTLLSQLIEKANFTSGKLVSDNSTNKLWSFSSRGINYLTTSKLSGEKKVNAIPFPEEIRKDVVDYESITQLKEQKFLLGSTSGYIVVDLDKIVNHEHEININQISVSRLKNNDSIRLVDITTRAEFKNKENNIKFSYSISEFFKTQKPEYQYKLEGIYDTWSDWTSNGDVLFENLPYGNYKFVVKGRVGNQETSNTAFYTFNIDRPWMLSNIAIAAYVIGLLLFSLLMHNIYKGYYKKQRERLMLKTTREFELKELENKQQLMRFKNEKLREDIDNKNRELGISTMNLIKKNEFLSSIKKELETIDDSRNIKNVIKIIDRNLNNNDDWNLFQEAFNNADKDFLKKIKQIHPALTANDLRLCAYLRLNLSSKEIAPLLNISPRSVEVKRYRLRKKMELPHESNLSDYILEI